MVNWGNKQTRAKEWRVGGRKGWCGDSVAACQSRIEDVDFAAETTNMTKAQILTKAATSMLAQANASKEDLLMLLQGWLGVSKTKAI